MATLIGNNKPSMMAFPSALNRMGTFPIDISSVWYSYDEAVAYATQTNFTPKYEGQTGLPYVGQILTVVETAEDGTTSVTAYSIQNEAGELAQVGTVTLGDNKTIVRDEETGVLTLVGFADAEEGEFAVVGADGNLDWKKIAADEATITNDEGTLTLKGIKELTWKDGEGEDAKDVAVYQPKLVKKDGKVVLTWEIPSAVTVEGLDTRLKTAEDNIGINAEAIKTINETTIPAVQEDIKNIEEVTIPALEDAIEAVATDLADNYYDKVEVDKKLTSIFKFKGVKTYKSELPTTGQIVGDVWLVIYDGDAPAEGEANILPVSNTEYVWTTENKWEDLGDDLVDLTNYYTKSEVDGFVGELETAIGDLEDAITEDLGKKGAVANVTDGTSDWSVTVSYADDTEATQAAIKTVLAGTDAGLVKNGGVATIADGIITAISEANHAASADEATYATNADNATNAVHANTADEADHAATADYATEAGKVTNKLSIKIAEGEGNTVEFNGSEAKSVDLSIYAKSTDLNNYYTASEADSNFMSETETNDAIAAVTDPIEKDIADIIGDIPEEGYVLPNLVNIGERLDAHDEALEGLGTQVETANDTASAANATAGEAKTIAGEAKKAATSANAVAGEAKEAATSATTTAVLAKDLANGAVSTANTASSVANDAKIAAEGAVSTADTAKKTADEAKAAAGVNAAAITALQTKDTEFTASINALNEADSKHTEDIAKNAADIAGHTGTLTSYGTRLGTVEGKVSTLEGTVSNLTGAFKFKGEVESNPTAEGFDVSSYADGDVVIFGLKEYVFTNGKFIEFGDEGSYLTKAAAEADYLKKADAVNAYAAKSEFETLRDTTVPAAAKTAEWASVSGKPNLSYIEAKETTFSSTTTLTAEEGKIRNIEVYDADGERVILDIKRTNDLSYTLTAVGSTETLTVTYEVIHTVA